MLRSVLLEPRHAGPAVGWEIHSARNVADALEAKMIPRIQCGTVRDYSLGEVLYWGILAIVTIAGLLYLAH
jgi:hypothetical protein